MLEAYDDNILAEQGGVNPSAPAIGGWYSMFGGDGCVSVEWPPLAVRVTGGTVVRYYNDSDSVDASAVAGIGFSTEFARRTTLSANQTFAYSPSYLTGLFRKSRAGPPGTAPPVALTTP